MKIQTKLFAALALGALTAIPSQAQLLKGTIKGMMVDDAIVNYSADGYVIHEIPRELKINADSTFTFDMDFEGQTADVSIDLGHSDVLFGAHLVKGKTVEMNITKLGPGNYKVDFKGQDKAISQLVNQMKDSYDGMKYWSPDPTEGKSIDEYLALLEQNHKKVTDLLKGVKDKNQRSFYTRLADGNYKWNKIRLFMDEAENQNSTTKRQEYYDILKDVDVNDPINYQTNLSLSAINSKVKAPYTEYYNYGMEQMALVNQLVTLPALRQVMVQMIGQSFYVYGKGQDRNEEFTKRYLEFAGSDKAIAESIIAQWKATDEATKGTQAGTPAPDITMQTVDGKSVQLRDLLQGKFTYIDVWATWCGPCVKEIPHVEKMVEHFKGNDKVQFISISVDSNLDAWKKKLDNDKPQWAQYVLTPENNQTFSQQWGITGIPRFIMIDAQGNIYSPDATRPSDPKTTETIEQLIVNN